MFHESESMSEQVRTDAFLDPMRNDTIMGIDAVGYGVMDSECTGQDESHVRQLCSPETTSSGPSKGSE